VTPSGASSPDALSDFRVYLALLWRSLNLPQPTTVQYDIATYLQHGPKRRVIEAFRGVGKSWITSAYVTWRLMRDPEVRCLVISASKDRSDAFTVFTKRLLNEIPYLQHLAPDPKAGDRDSNIAFDVRGAPPAHAPSVKSIGVYGQLAGSRANLIVIDDAEVPNNSETATQREKLIRRVVEGGGAVLSPGGEVVYLGTPQTEDSLYNHLPEHGYEVRVWPARVPEFPERYNGRLAPMIQALIVAGEPVGTPTDPARFHEIELGEREIEYGSAGFQLQFMLDTSLADADRYPLKLADFMVRNLDSDIAPEKLVWGSAPEQVIEYLPNPGFEGDRWHKPMFVSEKYRPYETRVMYIDPSGRGADETGYCVLATLNGIGFILAWGGEQNGYDERTLVKLATLARDLKVNRVFVEDNFGDGMWTELFRPVLVREYQKKDEKGAISPGCLLEGDRVSGQKEQRIIDRLGPVLGAHRLVLDETVIRDDLKSKIHLGPDAVLKGGLHQLTRITRDRGCIKHDDRIEALAGAVHMAMGMLARDTDKAMTATHNAAFRKELATWYKHVSGGRNVAPRVWSDKI
jgi:hypothetical protein